MASLDSGQKKPGILARISNGIIQTMEGAFYRIGKLIAEHPFISIGLTFLFVVPWVLGIPFYFHEENKLEELWVPSDSRAYIDKQWVDSKFPEHYREQFFIIEADNVLEPSVIQQMLIFDKKVKAMTSDVYTWQSVCARLAGQCWSSSLLELWSFDEDVINSLTKTQILETINNATVSPVYGSPYNITLKVGGPTKNDTGYIVGAKATHMMYVLKTNATTITLGSDEASDTFEEDFVELGKATEKEIEDIARVYYYTVTSFDRVSSDTIFGDVNKLIIGYILIGFYVSIVLGKINLVQQRGYLAMAGLLCVGLAIGVSFGLCSYAGLLYGPLHSVLPFMVLGIGVDDMFVIVQCMETLAPSTRSLPIPERVALTMKNAGVSITVTSLTDMVAFGIGATTVIPALRSFCIYAAVGIVMTFIFQCTLFVACMSLDELRASQDRNGYCCWYIHKDYKPTECSQRSLMQLFFDRIYSPLVVKLPFKVIFFILAWGLFAGGIYGVAKMEQNFDFKWFLPSDTYAYKYFQKENKYFPHGGFPAAVFFGELDYHDYQEFGSLENLYRDLEADEFTAPGTVQSWYMSYRQWLNDSTSDLLNDDMFPKDEEAFYSLLNTYLTPPNEGIRFTKDIQFVDSTRTKIHASRVTLFNIHLANSEEEIDAMDRLREIVDLYDQWNEQESFAYTWFFVNYETNKIIQTELYRNIGMAFACIVLMVLILIAHVWTCILVSLCVIMTVIDVGGAMHYWGLTIDVVTSVQLILALGFAIDYSAHVGHTFMTQVGDRNERVKKTLHHIGPAVFHGGFSTFLAFILLAGSVSYVFRTFFKVFFCVVLFGLYHGLVFLPILLSWFGPAPYLSASESPEPPNQINEVKGNRTDNGSAVTMEMPHTEHVNPAYEEEEKTHEPYSQPAVQPDEQPNAQSAVSPPAQPPVQPPVQPPAQPSVQSPVQPPAQPPAPVPPPVQQSVQPTVVKVGGDSDVTNYYRPSSSNSGRYVNVIPVNM